MPQMLQAGGIVRELAQELRVGILGVGRLAADGVVSVRWRHGVNLLDRASLVKYLYNMSEAQIIKAIRRAAKRREKADQTRREATRELQDWCRKAQAAGIPNTQIASEAGLSRQGVYDLIGQPPGQ